MTPINRLLGVTLGMAAMFTTPLANAQAGAPVYIGSKINVSDVDRSIDFYTRLLGLKVASNVSSDGVKGEILLTPSGKLVDAKLTLVYDKSQHTTGSLGSQFVCLIFGVENLKGRIEALKAAGYAFDKSLVVKPPIPATPPYPASVKSVEIGFTKDPDGIPIEIVQWNISEAK